MRRPPTLDLALAGGFCAVSLLQVVLAPIAGPAASVLVAAGSTLPLAWRRTYPAAAALAGSAFWLVPTDGYLYLGFVVAALLYFSVGTDVEPLHRMLAVVGLGGAIGVAAVLVSDQHPSTAVGVALAVAGPAAVGRLVAHQRSQNRRLQELTDRLRGERVTSERAAVAEERSRIARELHDVIGHDVTVIALQADAAAAALAKAPERAAAPVAAIRRQASETLDEMRRVLGTLRTDPGRDGELRPQPGLSDLPALVDRSRSAGTTVDLDLTLPARAAPASVALAVYRVVQEGLTNARRHAPGASVRIRVHGDDDAIVVQVHDTGGAPGPACDAGLGLVGMRERVRVLGGELQAGPAPAGGFAVTARLPLDVPGSP